MTFWTFATIDLMFLFTSPLPTADLALFAVTFGKKEILEMQIDNSRGPKYSANATHCNAVPIDNDLRHFVVLF